MKKIIKRTLSVFLSFILAFSVFAILDYTPAITAEAANALNMQRRGGVQVVFSTSTSATQTDTYYIDPSSSSTYYLILINNSTQTATITGISNSSYVSGWPSISFTIASGGRTYYTLNKSSMSTSDLTKYDFTVTYALADVYESDGATLATFNQPAYIYTWYSSDDSKSTSGFTVAYSGSDLNITNTFQTTYGILEDSSLSGDSSTDVSFVYNYWIDTTDLTSKEWETVGLRLYAVNNKTVRHHLNQSNASSSAGSFSLGGSFDTSSSTPSLTMGDVSTSWSGPVSSFWESITSDYVASSSNSYTATRLWEAVQANQYGTLINSSSGYFAFGGTLFEGSSTSSSPATIVFDKMHWRKPGVTGSSNQRDGYFSGTINCYIYDKSALQSYVSAIGSLSDFSPMSERYTDEAWSAYQTALDNAMEVLANQKTTQYDVDKALADLKSAHDTLNSSSSLETRVVYATHSLYGDGDCGETNTSSSSTSYYILAPLGTKYTVPYYSTYYNQSNKVTEPYTQTWTTSSASGIINMTYYYWTIDQTGLDALIEEANELLTKDWCYNDTFKDALQELYDLLVEYNTDYNDSPTLQSAVESTVKETEDLIADESNDAYHTHVDSDSWVVTTKATCTTDGVETMYCKYCGVELRTQPIDKTGHDVTYTSNGDGTHSGVCSNCGETITEDCTIVPSETVSATCTEDGYTVYTCTVCGYSYTVVDTGSATGHTPDGEGEVTQAATCEEDGIMTYTCSVCGETYTEAIPAIGHNYEAVVTPPTCTEGGYTTYTCKNCGDSYVADKTEAIGHTWDEGVVTDPTCTAQGYTTYTCTVCQATSTGDYVEATGHSYEDVVTEPTCTEGGYTTHTCTVCGGSLENGVYVDNYTEALGHNYEEEVTKEPDCTNAGEMTYTCSRCGDTYTAEIPANGHSWDEGTVTKEATCTEDGVMTYECSACGETKTEVIVSPGHQWVYNVVEKEATCTETGLAAAECSVCGETDGEYVIPALGHDYDNGVVTKEATCYSEGEITYTCTVYKGELEDGIYTVAIAMLEHTWDEGVVTKEASCTEEGVLTYTCTVAGCGVTKTEQIPKTGHSYVSVTTAPTCTEQGYTTYTCANCGDSYVSDYTNALGHTWDSGKLTVNPTCTEEGEKLYTCTVCGETKTETVAAAGHSYENVVVPPTCTEKGYTEHTCLVCGDYYTDNETPAVGHTYTITVVDPTCTAQGYTRYVCTVCGLAYRDDYTDPTGHSYVAAVTEPTCTAQGYTVYTCSVCGDKYTADYTDALGHDYAEEVVDPTCTEMGYTVHTCTRCGSSYKDSYVEALGHSYEETERVAATETKSGYVLYTCTRCKHTYKDTLYTGGKALVCVTLADTDGNVLAQAEITATNTTTGESFSFVSDLNGYFTYVLSAGEWEFFVHKDGYLDFTIAITVSGGMTNIITPMIYATAETNPCDCLCHQTNVWARLFKVIARILRLFGRTIICCDDCALWD
ncbi:MAG: FIVAR domain-containing protein [Clostridiales bacterium]|nr:FIVAR domain-containing protein [Clostridiales bacterium]